MHCRHWCHAEFSAGMDCAGGSLLIGVMIGWQIPAFDFCRVVRLRLFVEIEDSPGAGCVGHLRVYSCGLIPGFDPGQINIEAGPFSW